MALRGVLWTLALCGLASAQDQGANGTNGTNCTNCSNGTRGSDPRDAVCGSYRNTWDGLGCFTFFTSKCGGAELRFAMGACGGGGGGSSASSTCRVALWPSAVETGLINASSCSAYCGRHGLTCVAAWFANSNNDTCDGARNASCTGLFSAGGGAQPACECGGYSSMPSGGPTELERRIAPQCMEQLNGYDQCMKSHFAASDPEYYNEHQPPQSLRERVAWALRTPGCAFISRSLAQKLGARACSNIGSG